MQDIPEWRARWNQWLAERYKDRAGLAAAWGADLQAGEDPARGTVAMPPDFSAPTLRTRDAIAFISATERDTFARMSTFLRKELGVKALLTNMNGWSNRATDQSARLLFDYVDDHFYVDHPQFLETPWRLPSRCPNTSPIANGAETGRQATFVRLLDKPFTISEYNYSCPGRFRGVGGILTGAMGALQGWGGIWRFAYSHNRDNLFAPMPLNYFDMADDPMGQAAERAAICLFLRGDMRAAPHSIGVAMTRAALANPPASIPWLCPQWHWAAWVTRVGTYVPGRTGPSVGPLLLDWTAPTTIDGQRPIPIRPYEANDAAIAALLREQGILAKNNPTDPAEKIFRSETGEITIDAPRNTMILDTPRTAGGFAPAGQTITTAAGVTVAVQATDATVWVSSLDGGKISGSKRLLVTHLTDLQNSEITYAERDLQTLLAWGKLPHLVRAGKAAVSVKHADAAQLRVWALSTDGRRLAQVPAEVKGGALTFTADVAAFAREHGAVFCYEVAGK